MNGNNNFLKRLLFFLIILVFAVVWISDALSYGKSGVPMALLGGLFLVPTVFFSAKNIFNPLKEQPPSYYDGGRRERRRYIRYYNQQKVRSGDKAYFASWFQGQLLSTAMMLIIFIKMATSGVPVLTQLLLGLILSLQITDFINVLADYRKNKNNDNWGQDNDPWDL